MSNIHGVSDTILFIGYSQFHLKNTVKPMLCFACIFQNYLKWKTLCIFNMLKTFEVLILDHITGTHVLLLLCSLNRLVTPVHCPLPLRSVKVLGSPSNDLLMRRSQWKITSPPVPPAQKMSPAI